MIWLFDWWIYFGCYSRMVRYKGFIFYSINNIGEKLVSSAAQNGKNDHSGIVREKKKTTVSV